MARTIVSIIGPCATVSRLADMGIVPGQRIQVIQDGVWKIDGRFTVGMRLTNTEIVLE
jgi:Fe2+ transport system protein FeoA